MISTFLMYYFYCLPKISLKTILGFLLSFRVSWWTVSKLKILTCYWSEITHSIHAAIYLTPLSLKFLIQEIRVCIHCYFPFPASKRIETSMGIYIWQKAGEQKRISRNVNNKISSNGAWIKAFPAKFCSHQQKRKFSDTL